MRKSKIRNTDIDLNNGKLPPQAIDAEECVLGALLLDNKVLPTIISLLPIEAFYRDEHQKIYTAIKKLHSLNHPVDIITVIEQMRSDENLEIAGGQFYINKITSRVASAANVERHAYVMLQKFISRELIRISYETIRDAYDNSIDELELYSQCEKKIASLSPIFTSNKIDPVSLMDDAMKQMFNPDPKSKPIKTGIEGLDILLGGLCPGNLTVIAARPGMAKTTLICYLIMHAALQEKASAGMIQLEQSRTEIAYKLLSSLSGLTVEEFKAEKFTPDQTDKIVEAANQIKKSKIYIDTDPFLNASTLKSKATKMVQEHGIKVLFIDYLGLADITGESDSNDNTATRIAYFTKKCKALAKSLNIAIVLLSQLNREVEKRPSKRPILSDLKDSGAIEADADAVIFLFRPEYYGITEVEIDGNTYTGDQARGAIELIVAKNRHGRTGSVWSKVDLAMNRFNVISVPDYEKAF